ncbi:hypothetical protein CLCR_06499 [Cladophialophora carrionii]|uniref:Uncharacterized protein n=1 Tax=Cladophialophora carrionii TaxID=86049 RepID=A0A1C1CA67_9EURO|nr:hypothetical protein CLCR_06499 [Cladophialophora carrionii]
MHKRLLFGEELYPQYSPTGDARQPDANTSHTTTDSRQQHFVPVEQRRGGEKTQINAQHRRQFRAVGESAPLELP